jgi:hypothetical protein
VMEWKFSMRLVSSLAPMPRAAWLCAALMAPSQRWRSPERLCLVALPCGTTPEVHWVSLEREA